MDADIFIDFVRQFVTSNYSHLNLKNLENIDFTSDFANDVVNFQKDHGLQEGYTNEQQGTAVAKVISYELNEEIRRYVFIDSEIFFGIASKNINIALNLLIHELGHVHDDNTKNQIFSEKEIKIQHAADLKNILYTIADITWSEYAADYFAAGLAEPEFINNRKNHIRTLIDHVKDSVYEAISEYKHNEISKYRLFNSLQESSHLLLKISANYLGMMRGKDLKIIEYSDIFGDSYFTPILSRLDTELSSMMNRYPNWESKEVFYNLSIIIQFLWECLGVQINYRDEDEDIEIILM